MSHALAQSLTDMSALCPLCQVYHLSDENARHDHIRPFQLNKVPIRLSVRSVICETTNATHRQALMLISALLNLVCALSSIC